MPVDYILRSALMVDRNAICDVRILSFQIFRSFCPRKRGQSKDRHKPSPRPEGPPTHLCSETKRQDVMVAAEVFKSCIAMNIPSHYSSGPFIGVETDICKGRAMVSK